MARKDTKAEVFVDIIRVRKETREPNRETGESRGLSKRQVEQRINRKNRKERKIAAGY